jgi:hypothetical protein
MSCFTIYNPVGVHTKDNPCDCGHCAVYPEFFHAPAYTKKWNTNWDDMKALRDEVYPDGVIIENTGNSNYDNTKFIRENGEVVTYNKDEHKWYNQDGTLHSQS